MPEAYRFRAIDAVLVVLRDHTETPRTERLDDRRFVRYGPDGRPAAVELRQVSSGVALAGLPSRLTVSVLLRRLGIEIVDEGLGGRVASALGHVGMRVRGRLGAPFA